MTTWTKDRIADLIRYSDAGLSCSLIAARLGDCTRNAVIGKLHRMGRSIPKPTRQLKPGRAKFSRPPPPPPKPYWRAPIVAMPPPRVDDVVRVSFADLEEHHCRFIPGEPTEGYCGLPHVAGTSYCAGHLARCTTSPGYLPRTIAVHDKIGGLRTDAANVAEALEPA